MDIYQDMRRSNCMSDFTQRNGFHLDETYISSHRISGIIPRVPLQLLAVNQKAYVPHELGIGYYHNKVSLRFMQRCKIYWLVKFLQKYGITVENYERTMSSLSDDFYSCYTSDRDDGTSSFADIMDPLIFDSCFIFELMRKYEVKELDDSVFDSILTMPLKLRAISRDLLLVENQIPFFVIENVCRGSGILFGTFKNMVANFFNNHLSIFGFISPESGAEEHKHLLDLVHTSWRPSSNAAQQGHNYKSYNLSNIQSATKLRESAAVKFGKAKRQEHDSNLFHIRFVDVNGTLEFQTIVVDSDTETVLRNMMAYEQLTPDNGGNYVTHYMQLMNCLIKSTEDVDFFCQCGIIDGMGKDHNAILQFFSSFRVSMSDSCPNFFYSAEMDNLGLYCNRKRNKFKAKWDSWMVILKRDYFNSPWALISLVAAFILLGLTLLQTLYTILSYYNSNNKK